LLQGDTGNHRPETDIRGFPLVPARRPDAVIGETSRAARSEPTKGMVSVSRNLSHRSPLKTKKPATLIDLKKVNWRGRLFRSTIEISAC